MVDATLPEIMNYFGYRDADGKLQVAKFRREWAELSDESKQQIRQGIGNGSLTY